MGGGVILTLQPASTTGMAMQWFHDELYLTGQFNEAGGMPLEDALVKWNRHQWCSLPGNLDDPNTAIDRVLDMTVWRDSLFVCGSFTTIDGEPARHVAQWIGGEATLDCSPSVGVTEYQTPGVITLVPNPATTTITIQGLSSEVKRIQVVDALGKIVMQVTPSVTLDISFLPHGAYSLQAFGDSGRILANERFVK